MNGLAVVDPPSLLCRGDREADREMGLTDAGRSQQNDVSILVVGSSPISYSSSLWKGHHAEAQYNLGLMYAYGLGVVKDEAEGVRWYAYS